MRHVVTDIITATFNYNGLESDKESRESYYP